MTDLTHDHGHAHDHAAEAGIRGISLTSQKPLDGIKVTNWLNALLQDKGPDILRAKGILDIKGDDRRLVFQAVHMILEGDYQRPWTAADNRYFLAAIKEAVTGCTGTHTFAHKRFFRW